MREDGTIYAVCSFARKLGQDGGNDYFRGTCCYARELKKSALPTAERYYLEINGANSSADVYMNGKHLAHHDGDMLHYVLTEAENKTVAEQISADFTAEFQISQAHLWDGVKDPYLYTATVSVLRDGKLLDTVSARFGCRSFAIDPQKGFLLNGREYPLRGVSRHQDRAKEAKDHFFYFEVPNQGETELLAVAGECEDTSAIRKVEKMNPDYILTKEELLKMNRKLNRIRKPRNRAEK